MNKLIKERKMCANCGMKAMFTNKDIDLVTYGTVTLTDKLQCQNCGALEGRTTVDMIEAADRNAKQLMAWLDEQTDWSE